MKKVTVEQSNEARLHLLQSSVPSLVDAAIEAIRNDEDAEEAIKEAASRAPWGSWDAYFGLTDEWINTPLHNSDGKEVTDPMDANDMNEQWEKASQNHLDNIISVAKKIIAEEK